MKSSIKFLLILLFSSFGALSSQALNASGVSEVDRFVGTYFEQFPKENLYDSIIALDLDFEKSPIERINMARTIYRKHYVWDRAEDLVKSIVGFDFHNGNYNDLSEYLVYRYLERPEERRALKLMMDVMQTMEFSEAEIRRDTNKKESFMPHFEKGVSDVAFASTLLWFGIRGRGVGKWVSKKTGGDKLKTTGTALAGRIRAWHEVKIKSSAIYSVASMPRMLIFDKTGKVRPFIKDAGAVTAFAGGIGLTYGGISYWLHKWGLFDKKSPIHELDKNVYGLSVLELECKAKEFSDLVDQLEWSKMDEVDRVQLIRKLRSSANSLVDDFSALVEMAPIYLVSKDLKSDINTEIQFSNGQLKYKDLSVTCSGLKPTKKVIVNLQGSREVVRSSIAKLLIELTAYKYGAVESSVEGLRKRISEEAYKTVSSQLVASSGAAEKLEEGFEKQKIFNAFKKVLEVSQKSELDQYFLSALMDAFSVNDGIDLDPIEFEEVAQDILMTVPQSRIFNYLYELWESKSGTVQDRSFLILLFVAVDKQYKELYLEGKDLSVEASPLMILAELFEKRIEVIESMEVDETESFDDLGLKSVNEVPAEEGVE